MFLWAAELFENQEWWTQQQSSAEPVNSYLLALGLWAAPSGLRPWGRILLTQLCCWVRTNHVNPYTKIKLNWQTFNNNTAEYHLFCKYNVFGWEILKTFYPNLWNSRGLWIYLKIIPYMGDTNFLVLCGLEHYVNNFFFVLLGTPPRF